MSAQESPEPVFELTRARTILSAAGVDLLEDAGLVTPAGWSSLTAMSTDLVELG